MSPAQQYDRFIDALLGYYKAHAGGRICLSSANIINAFTRIGRRAESAGFYSIFLACTRMADVWRMTSPSSVRPC
jgi:hypothetical protein